MQGVLKKIIVTADDFGLSHRITDTILEVADQGLLTRVSILANGCAVEYALKEWEKRKDELSLALHFNITEGKAISSSVDVPHLVCIDGTFRYSATALIFKTWTLFPRARRLLKKEIECELRAQLSHIRDLAPNIRLSINSHHHVHMIPLVLKIFSKLHKEEPFEDIRIISEPLFIIKGPYFISGFIRYFKFKMLYILNRHLIKRLDMPHSDYFIGTFSSGQMILLAIQEALAEVNRKDGKTVEIGFHLGETFPGELEGWNGDVGWHSSPHRKKEKELIQSDKFKELINSFLQTKSVK